jgi:hypothetical protein
MVIQVYQPLNEGKINLIVSANLKLAIDYLSFFMIMISCLLFIFSLEYHLYQNDSIYFSLWIKFIYNHKIKKPNNYSFTNSGSYKFCRSPVRSSILIFTIFSISLWDIGKVIFTLFLFGGLYADLVAEEVFYIKSEEYLKYRSSVKNIFIPSLYMNSSKFSNKKEKK